MASNGSMLTALALLATMTTLMTGDARPVDAFKGLYVRSSLRVTVTVGDARSLSVNASEAAMSTVKSYVDYWGTLILHSEGAAQSLPIEVDITVPTPLSYIIATSQAEVHADKIEGSISASGRSLVIVQSLETTWPTSISAAAESEVRVAGGKVGGLSVSSAAASKVEMGSLAAGDSSLTAAAKSSISGLTLSSGVISCTSQSSVSTAATGQVGVSCSNSEVHVSGSALLTVWSQYDCKGLPRRMLSAELPILP